MDSDALGSFLVLIHGSAPCLPGPQPSVLLLSLNQDGAFGRLRPDSQVILLLLTTQRQKWYTQLKSNQRPSPCHRDVLPLNYGCMVLPVGIAPTSPGLQSGVSPSFTKVTFFNFGGPAGSRTPNFCVQGRRVTASTTSPYFILNSE